LDRVFGFEYKPGDVDKNPPQHPPGLVWIDHHKSSILTHPASIPGYRVDGVAACRLAWQWFAASEESMQDARYLGWPPKQDYIDRKVLEPLAVRLAGEYDIWDKRDPNAELFQHGLRSQELDDTDWQMLLDLSQERFVSRLLTQGECLQYARTKENKGVIERLGFTFQWEGLTWLGCNHATFNSHLFTAGLKPEHDACFGFKYDGKGGWAVSLYHAPGKEHNDLSVIATKHGGGGHKGACGFRTTKLPFIP
jgi:oligoribonuclease NrnB/cAMP/cGMP phosphodiesterase (DHH superfamily)